MGNTTDGPGFSFYDANTFCGNLIGNSTISVSVGSFSTTLNGIEITRNMVIRQDLFVDDDLLVDDDCYI